MQRNPGLVLNESQVAWLTRIAPQVIYGSIVLAAVVGSLDAPLPRATVVVLTVSLSLLGVSFAKAYAKTIEQDMVSREPMSWRRRGRIVLAPSWFMATTSVPIVFFGCAALGWISGRTAFFATKIVLVALLLFFGLVARRVCGGGWLVSIREGATVALLGYAVIQIKIWSKYLPKLDL